MKPSNWFILSAFVTLVACAAPGEAGDPCTTDADCAEGLECHDHADHTPDGAVAEESGMCEEHEEHDEEEHDEEDHADE